jgi:hypothetical protein
MGYYTRSQLVAMLVEVDAAIAKARTDQAHTSGGPGDGMVVQRANLRTLLDEREWILKEIEKIDAAGTGGFTNQVKFIRP